MCENHEKSFDVHADGRKSWEEKGFLAGSESGFMILTENCNQLCCYRSQFQVYSLLRWLIVWAAFQGTCIDLIGLKGDLSPVSMSLLYWCSHLKRSSTVKIAITYGICLASWFHWNCFLRFFFSNSDMISKSSYTCGTLYNCVN